MKYKLHKGKRCLPSMIFDSHFEDLLRKTDGNVNKLPLIQSLVTCLRYLLEKQLNHFCQINAEVVKHVTRVRCLIVMDGRELMVGLLHLFVLPWKTVNLTASFPFFAKKGFV